MKAVFKGGADAVIVHKGLVRYLTDSIGSIEGELIIHSSASTALARDAQSTRKELDPLWNKRFALEQRGFQLTST